MARPTKLTPKKRAQFLAALAEGYTVTHAAEGAGLVRQQMYVWRAADPAFAVAWDAALEAGSDVLEDEARRRAVDGVTQEKGIYHRGSLVGSVIETTYSDTLLIFLLKARRPHVYREHVDLHHSGTIQHEHYDLTRLNDTELDALERLVANTRPDSDARRN